MKSVLEVLLDISFLAYLYHRLQVLAVSPSVCLTLVTEVRLCTVLERISKMHIFEISLIRII